MINGILDINNFGPFHSDVWGTVSDFVLVGSGILTILLLLWTYKSQQRVLEMQSKITLFEQKRFESEIVPILKSNIINHGLSDLGDDSFVGVSFSVTNTGNNSAHKVSVHVDNEFWIKWEPYKDLGFFPPGGVMTIYIGTRKEKKGSLDEENRVCNININYFDVLGNEFIHTVTYNPINQSIAGGMSPLDHQPLYDSGFKRVV